MIKIVFQIFLVMQFFNCTSEGNLQVSERAKAIQVDPGYYVSEESITFNFKKRRYLVQSQELFDKNGLLVEVKILKSEGYLSFLRPEINKLKNFVTRHNFSDKIKSSMVDEKHLEINSKVFLIAGIDKGNKRIFYAMDKNESVIYYLGYN